MRIRSHVRVELIWPLALSASIAACNSSHSTLSGPATPKIVLQSQISQTNKAPAEDDCGLTSYPVARPNAEIIADVPPAAEKPPNSNMIAKLAIDKDGKVTHLRVIRLAHSDLPNWKEINNSALDVIKLRHYKPTIYQGQPVAVCSDANVIIDF